MEQRITAQYRLQKKENLPLTSHRIAGRWLCSLRPCIFLVLVALFPSPRGAEAVVITSNIIHRTFHIRWNNSIGTGFTIDHGSKQYLVTARHVVDGIESGKPIKIFYDKSWKDLVVNVVGTGKGDVDVAVLACSIRLSPSLPLIASSKHLTYGHPISFLGYPLGWNSGGEEINRGVSLPFVKAGVVSALVFDDDVDLIFLDAHGNKGFSGGPVVFVPYGQPENKLRVAGIIVRYPPPSPLSRKTVFDSRNEPIGYVQENPGFIVAIDIKHARELIDANPIGFPLPADKDSQ